MTRRRTPPGGTKKPGPAAKANSNARGAGKALVPTGKAGPLVPSERAPSDKSRAAVAAAKVAARLGAAQRVDTSEPAVRAAALAAEKIAAAGSEGLRAAAAAAKQVTAAAQKQDAARAEQQRFDDRHMRRALELAEAYRGRTTPNPVVGCVIVDAIGNVIAEGAHQGPGTKHGEIDALDKLGRKAKGGTLYVNLEPCMHQGRTPPCAPVVAAAGLARVVVGSEDPIEGHRGGMEFLRSKGITVTRAVVEECDLANLPFIRWATARLPAFTLKAAVTLDGKIATVGGQSQWITGEEARAHAHRLRDTHDAVLVGLGTVLADDPRLSARLPGARDPVRVVVDSQLRMPPKAKLLPGKTGPRTIIATTERASAAAEKALVKAGAEVWRLPPVDGRTSLEALASRLAEEGIQSVLVEGGGILNAALLACGLATDIQLFVAPLIVGGPAPSWVGGAGVEQLTSGFRLRFVGRPLQLGEDVLVRAVVRGSS